MVRANNKRKRAQPRPRTGRPTRRNVQRDRALGLRPVSCRVPSDPPLRTLSHEHSAVIRVNLMYNPTSKIDNGDDFKTALYQAKGIYTFSPRTIWDLVLAYMGYKSGLTAELRLNKVMAWGPIQSPSAEYSPVLSVDISNISAAHTVTDRGTETIRSKCGIALPFSIWLGSESTTNIVSYHSRGSTVTDASTGVIDISVTWRRALSPLWLEDEKKKNVPAVVVPSGHRMGIACPLQHQGVNHFGKRWWSIPLPIIQSALLACGLSELDIQRITAMGNQSTVNLPSTRALMPENVAYFDNHEIVDLPNGDHMLEFSTRLVQPPSSRRRRHHHGDVPTT